MVKRSIAVELGFAFTILVLLVLFAAGHLRTGAGSVSLNVTMQGFSHDIVKVGTSATTTLHATPGSDYNPPVPKPDEGSLSDTFTWSLTVLYSQTATGQFQDAGTPGPKNYTYGPNPLPPASPVPLVFTPEKAGYWKVSVNCSVLVKDSKNSSLSWSGSGKAGPRDLTSAIVTFSPNPIITGADKTNPGAVFAPVTATVSPKDFASHISLNHFAELPNGTGSANSKDAVANNTTGTVTFDVYGITGTAASMPGGDVEIEAESGSVGDTPVLGTALVKVVIPYAIAKPYKTYNGPVAPKNAALNAGTVPALWSLPVGKVNLVTEAGTSLSMNVDDQFGNPLDKVYDGQTVYEGGKSINVTINGGTYSDWVGVATTAPNPPWNPNPCVQGGQEEQNWLTAPIGAVANQTVSGSRSVEIAGFTLNPTPFTRTVKYQNGTLTVTVP